MSNEIRIYIVLACLVLALIPANMAKTRNRSFWWYYLFSFIFPILIPLHIIILAIIGHKKEVKDVFDMRICPTCKEATPIKSKKCINCGAL